jgi:predicted nucleic acid-binding protein
VSVVLDSSITLSWYFEDERTDASYAVLQLVAEEGAVVPPLWRFEVANGLQMAVRRKRIDSDFRDGSLADLTKLEIATDPDSDAHAWSQSSSSQISSV